MPPILLRGESEGACGFAVDGGEGFAEGVADLISAIWLMHIVRSIIERIVEV